MVGESPGRTFISYSRKDGAEYAAWLRAWLGERDLSVWRDLESLEGGPDWWSQIEDALRSKALHHFVLVVTPAALASPYVRREIRLARQEGKTVCPVREPGLRDLGALPRWLGQIYDLALTEHQTTLIRVLQDVSRQKRVPMMAPEPPKDFVRRPKEFDALKRLLLDAKGDAVAAITAALKGAGGYGKTTLAKALAHDSDIQDAYFDGILWAELGEKPERLLSILTDQIEVLTGERPGLETINAAAGKLGEALGDRRILLIVDDAWREPDLRPFLQGGPHCVRLVTTRIDSVLPQTALRQPVDAMQASEALSLISAALPEDQVASERANLKMLAARLGEWAQLLKIVNGFLRDRVVKAHESLSVAIVGANKRLDARGLVVFDARDDADRAKAVARTIRVSLELLSEAERARFGELGVFPEDAEIPIGIVARLWAAGGGLEDFEAEDLLKNLFDLSLLLDLDFGQRFCRLHDTTRHFLRDREGKDGLVAQHRQLVAALDGVASGETDARNRRYYYLNLPHHLAEAQERARLDALLLDPGWLQAKLETTANPHALVADYQRYGVGEAQSLIGGTLRLIRGICVRDASQLPVQLIGRLAGFEAVAGSGFIDRVRRLLPHPSIVPLKSTLTPPGVETARLEGRMGSVATLCLLADGRLASGSGDGTIRLWDVETGADTARLEEGRAVNALCLLADGRLASDSKNGTIRLWDAATGAETARLEGHLGRVNALCLLADGRLASGSNDRTILLWDATTGGKTARIVAHTDRVTALCLLTDGRFASGSEDRGIRLWASTTGAATARLEGHTDTVTALCQLTDGRLVSGSKDGTIRLWDAATGVETARLVGHTDAVNALCLLADGRLASGSADETIRLWDAATGVETARLVAHTDTVTALCRLKDGRLASGSGDNTIRLWDAAAGAETARPDGQTGHVTALCLLPDGRLASISSDKMLRLWDTSTRAETARLAGHEVSAGVLWIPSDPRDYLRDNHGTICLMGAANGAQTAGRVKHRVSVSDRCLLADGRLASGSYDGTIRVWNAATGVETARLEGHTDDVNTLCLLADGRLASGSDDRTIRLWDAAIRAEIARLELDAPVNALVAIAPNRLVAGDQRGLLHWLEVVD